MQINFASVSLSLIFFLFGWNWKIFHLKIKDLYNLREIIYAIAWLEFVEIHFMACEIERRFWMESKQQTNSRRMQAVNEDEIGDETASNGSLEATVAMDTMEWEQSGYREVWHVWACVYWPHSHHNNRKKSNVQQLRWQHKKCVPLRAI